MWFDHTVLVIAMACVLLWALSLFIGDPQPAAPTNRPGFSRYYPGDPGFHCADDPSRCGGWRGFDNEGRR